MAPIMISYTQTYLRLRMSRQKMKAAARKWATKKAVENRNPWPCGFLHLFDLLSFTAFEVCGKIWISVWSSEADGHKVVNSSVASNGVLLSKIVVAVNVTGHETSFYLHVYAGIGLLQCKSLNLWV